MEVKKVKGDISSSQLAAKKYIYLNWENERSQMQVTQHPGSQKKIMVGQSSDFLPLQKPETDKVTCQLLTKKYWRPVQCRAAVASAEGSAAADLQQSVPSLGH